MRAGARQSSRCTVSQEPASHHETERPIPRAVRRSISCWPRALCGQQLLAVAGTVCTSQHSERVLGFLLRQPSPLRLARTADAGPELTLPVAIVSAEVGPTPAKLCRSTRPAPTIARLPLTEGARSRSSGRDFLEVRIGIVTFRRIELGALYKI